MTEALVRALLAGGYASILVGIFICRKRIPKWIKPLGIVVIPQILVWFSFYTATFFLDVAEYNNFFVALSRFGHMLDITMFWVLLLLIRDANRINRN